jgi:isocitrate/isopropylmalate dehydrogenase
VMQVAAQQHGVTIDVAEALVGGAAIDDCGHPLPESTLSQAKQAGRGTAWRGRRS